MQEAEQYFRQALALNPSYVEAHNNLGNVLIDLKCLDDAEQCFLQAAALDPERPETYNNLGNLLRGLKRLPEAEQYLRRALAIKPDYAEAHHGLGVVLGDLQRFEDAERSLRQALSINPEYAEAHHNLGVVLRSLGQLDAAERSLRRALALRPGYAEAHNSLGNTLLDQGRLDEAEHHCRQALAINPKYAEACNSLGLILRGMGRLGEAEQFCRQALALMPDSADLYNNLGSELVDLSRFEEAEDSYRQALALKPDFAAAHSNLIFTMDLAEGRDLREQQAERRQWYEQHGRKFAAGIRPQENSADPRRTLRIGYVSADFRRHSAYYTFSPVIYGHDRSAFEVYCYSGVKREDDATARLKEAVHGWRSTVGVSDEALEEQIRRDRIDILVDLSGHSAGNRLLVFARKPAPVQVTAWGHATGTGLETIDYFLADAVLVPKKDRALFAEKVVDLPCVLCYAAPDYAPEVQPLPALGGKPFTFGCINRIEKISDKSLSLWGQIMAALPGAGLLLKDHKLADAKLKEDFLGRLGAVGIKPERVRLLGGSPHAEHLKIYHEVDLGLDPFPHGGGVSTAEALWMGVPVVTLPGQTLTSRASASMLTALEMQDWFARSDADYARIALKAAGNLPRLAGLRQRLRAQMAGSVVGDTQRYTAAVEKAYRSMWLRWCKQSLPRKSG
jgi:predicted O-linked N-acetylglucosamine transferase (SPINDLY family)